MIVSGSSGALRFEGGIDAGLRKDSKQIHLIGYMNAEEQETAILDKETYQHEMLKKYTKLLFEGRE